MTATLVSANVVEDIHILNDDVNSFVHDEPSERDIDELLERLIRSMRREFTSRRFAERTYVSDEMFEFQMRDDMGRPVIVSQERFYSSDGVLSFEEELLELFFDGNSFVDMVIYRREMPRRNILDAIPTPHFRYVEYRSERALSSGDICPIGNHDALVVTSIDTITSIHGFVQYIIKNGYCETCGVLTSEEMLIP